jgi:hypothetical protein
VLLIGDQDLCCSRNSFRFVGADGDRARGGNQGDEPERGLADSPIAGDAVDQSDLLRFLHRDPAGGLHQVLGARPADQTRQALGASGAGDDGEGGLGQRTFENSTR